MQLIVPTAKLVAQGTALQTDEVSLRRADVSIALGTKLLGHLRASSRIRSLRSRRTNGGAGAVKKWLADDQTNDLDLFVELIPWDETRGYVKRVTMSELVYAYLYESARLRRAQRDSTRDFSMKRDPSSLVIVPTDLHVEHLGARGVPAETRRSLFRRLVTSFLPSHTFASPLLAFLTASDALQNPVLARAVERELDLLTDAHGTAHAALVVLAKGRLRGFKKAIDASTRTLLLAGLEHARTSPELLANALTAADPDDVIRVVGASRVVTRFIYDWSASDGAVFRALDAALSRMGGAATVTLPDGSAAFDGAREDSPHDVIADACARVLDAAPQFLPENVASTWTGPVAPHLLEKTRVIRAADLHAESAACAGDVMQALARGVPADGIGIALPLRGGALEDALQRALAEHGVRSSRQDAALASSAPVQLAFETLRADEAIPKTATRDDYVQYAYKSWGALELAREAGLGAFGILATDAPESALDRAELDAVALSAAAWDALALTDYVTAVKQLGVGEKSVTLDTFLAEIAQSMPGARDPASRRAGAVRIGALLDFVGLPLDLLVIMSRMKARWMRT